MIKNNCELEKILTNFCKNNNLNVNMFEIAIAGKGKGTGDRKQLFGPKSVKNKKCTYVIKLFLYYDIVVIWNYKNNTSMSCQYMTLKEKLDKGFCKVDKGKITHSHEQSVVLFEYTKNIEKLLNIIADKM